MEEKHFINFEKDFNSFLKRTDMSKYADKLCEAYAIINSAEHYITCALVDVYKLYPSMNYDFYADSYDKSLKITFTQGIAFDFQLPKETIEKFDKLNFSVIWWYVKLEKEPEKRIFEQYRKSK